MIVNVEQSSLGGMVVNVGRLVGIEEIIGSKVFSESRFNNTFNEDGKPFHSQGPAMLKLLLCARGITHFLSFVERMCTVHPSFDSYWWRY